ncbi:unnamed protein product, partial [Onchocerca ochengi]
TTLGKSRFYKLEFEPQYTSLKALQDVKSYLAFDKLERPGSSVQTNLQLNLALKYTAEDERASANERKMAQIHAEKATEQRAELEEAQL